MILGTGGFWDLLWKILVVLSVIGGIWVAIFFVLDQLKPFLERRFWFRRRWPWLVRGFRGSRDLTQLLRMLGRIEQQLGSEKNDMVFENIRFDLNHLTWSIWVEAMSVIALHSNRTSERCKALRNLSQVEDGQLMEHIIGVVTGVLHDPNAPKGVTRMAEAALRELEIRREIKSKSDAAVGVQKKKRGTKSKASGGGPPTQR